MNHPFQILMPEYIKLLSTMQVTSAGEIDTWAKKLTGPMCWPRYQRVQDETGVPGELIAALDYRESSANPRDALGQGDPWSQVSRHYPSGLGPWGSWSEAAIFYAHRQHLDDNSHQWSMPYACWKAEGWNGFGPRDRRINTGYLWAGTNHYVKGKYASDHNWDAEMVDPQLGAVPLMLRMMALRNTLLPGMPGKVQAPGLLPMAAPVGVGRPPVEGHDVKWLQAALNKVMLPPNQLVVDGNFGRFTRSALWDYQTLRGLVPDGLFGPATDAQLQKDTL